MQASMGWGLFLFYFVFDAVMFGFCWFSFKETRNKSLEKVDAEFEHRDMGIEAEAEAESKKPSNAGGHDHEVMNKDGEDRKMGSSLNTVVPRKAASDSE